MLWSGIARVRTKGVKKTHQRVQVELHIHAHADKWTKKRNHTHRDTLIHTQEIYEGTHLCRRMLSCTYALVHTQRATYT